MTLETLVTLLDYGSVLIFALTGALVASRAQLDLVGFVFMASLTAVGGGTLRDLILNRDAVFWVASPSYVVTATLAAILVFWTAHLFESRYKWLVWLDAVALSVAVAAGVGVAVEGGFGPVIVVMMGVMTGTFGGLMRDVVGNEVPLVLKQGQLYLTAAFGGAVAAVVLIWCGVPRFAALILCGFVVLALRAGSLRWGWSLPVYKPRPPRTRG
ncbi:trimeric intracellular cation channel family protein [Paracoccus fistulariae]|uniref:Trimeric intracellular cation channel family protein n=1 Tax=Paracoccus fistulariae TaxID=658446 RepID=A0ABY7SIA1_9RHOB|nr:trimeric intracellular cation channel family protein [Paracoccus fistulariae]MDB6182026.1 trimeric intracellular cation channel family protein [Paracoccus fistulariae]WCR06740.1 trimeric intracellular cation channel family protein [Paracoccus fistulariae]